MGSLGSFLRASWESFGNLLGVWDAKLNWKSFFAVSIFRKDRFGGILGTFFWFLEAILELILRLFRRPSSQQTEHAKSMFYVHLGYFGTKLSDFGTVRKIAF